MAKVLNNEELKGINRKLKSSGLEVSSGSKEGNTLYVGIEKGCAAVYNGQRVAKILSRTTGQSRIILDGREYIF